MNWISRAFWASFTFLAAVASNVYGNKDNTLSIVKILTPKFVEGYKSVMLLGANIECSMLYKCWTLAGSTNLYQIINIGSSY
jgi:hypothetical protein